MEHQRNMTMQGVVDALADVADPSRAHALSRFFKTKKGEYGYGDVFIGVRVPQQRAIARQFVSLSLAEAEALLRSDIHEHRLTALFILIHKSRHQLPEVAQLYIHNMDRVNNWDLVDASAGWILGMYLRDKKKSLLYALAASDSIWRRRIAMIATFAFIKEHDYADALKIAHVLIADSHDLIHKAVGWMLREIGNRDITVEEEFLKKHYKTMPRMMLRYAIEKFPQKKRHYYMTRG